MLQALKTYLSVLSRVFVQRSTTPDSVQVTNYDPKTVSKHAVDLDYKNVAQAILITELTDTGEELPVAIAFTNLNGTMTIVDISGLSEIE